MCHLLLSINNNGIINNKEPIKKLPVTSDELFLDILGSNKNDLNNKIVHNNNSSLYNNKIYFKNIFKHNDNPNGFIIISYKNNNYNMSDYEKLQINRIIKDISYII